jgi:hypothetical protein
VADWRASSSAGTRGVWLAGMASLTRTTMYASTWGMAERICRDDKEPVASFVEFVYDYGDLGIQHGILWGIFETLVHKISTQQFFFTGIFFN